MRPNVRIKKRALVYAGRVIRLFREELVADGMVMMRETIRHPGAVVIVPLLEGPRVVLVRQYRHAIGKDLLELPAGTLNPGEPLAACARRELAEETGWWPARLERLTQFYAAPGYTDEHMVVFLARGLRRVTAHHPDADEYVRPVTLTLKQALAKVHQGAICDAKSMVGLLLASAALDPAGKSR